MNFFSKQKVIAWSIVILIILNLGTLATLWINHFRRPEGRPPSGGGPPAHARAFLSRELVFDGDQKEALERLQTHQVAQMDAFQKEIDKTKREMMDELIKTDPDTAQVAELAGKVGEKEAQKARLTFSHLEEIKTLCRPDQKERFDTLVRELLEIMKPPGPEGPHGKRPHGRKNEGSPPRRGGGRGSRMDADGDGKVSKDEWADHHREIFRVEIDLDDDGYATETEWENHHRNKRP